MPPRYMHLGGPCNSPCLGRLGDKLATKKGPSCLCAWTHLGFRLHVLNLPQLKEEVQHAPPPSLQGLEDPWDAWLIAAWGLLELEGPRHLPNMLSG